MDSEPESHDQPGRKQSLIDRLIEKFSESRFFTISFVFHVLLIAIFGGTVLFEAMQEPPDFEGGEGGFLAAGEEVAAPPAAQVQPQETTFTVSTPAVQNTTVAAITTTGQNPLNFSMDAIITPSAVAKPSAPTAAAAAAPSSSAGMAGMTGATASDIRQFTGGWGKSSGSGTGTRQREFAFTAFVAKYSGGNWNSVYRMDGSKGIPQGALPNLLEFMSKASKDKIKTEYKNVKAIALDSGQLFSEKPPFVFFTGSRDFVLTEKEVENLRKYIRLGGAIWGDSSVPGKGSRFDIAFRREMRRVMPDKDKDFEALDVNDAMFKRAPYFPEIKRQPAGLNYYDDPVFVMRYFGEIAIIYTSNDYGDMWQFGVKEDGRNWALNGDRDEEAWEKGKPLIAQYEPLYVQAGIYVHNIDPKDIGKENGLLDSYKFGTNMIIHLLTRWEDKLRTAPRL
jgi:hypothetical protein